ncbi:MAG: NYN domain-containing protein [Clostridia bacterium]|nr:NYN domain-containing protein [Clostridia bacterium]
MNIAILIDAENVLPSQADLIFAHAQSLGNIVSREIYGAASALTSWVAPVLKYAIHPNLTIKASKGKNSSDIALVIGAMDLLAAGGFDAVIIASSDSDFSSLSVRLRNAGVEVIGMGNEKANALWRTACSSFVVFQNQKPAQGQQSPKPAQRQASRTQEAQKQPPRKQEQPQQAPVAVSHKERVAVIGQAILKRLQSSGGRLQVSTLFPMLNKLPEYKVDRQGSGKRPLNYLTSTYSDTFRFEDTPDGKNWVSLTSEEASDQGAPIPVEAPVEEEAPVE